jgi:hypothetical protein
VQHDPAVRRDVCVDRLTIERDPITGRIDDLSDGGDFAVDVHPAIGDGLIGASPRDHTGARQRPLHAHWAFITRLDRSARLAVGGLASGRPGGASPAGGAALFGETTLGARGFTARFTNAAVGATALAAPPFGGTAFGACGAEVARGGCLPRRFTAPL